MPFTFSHPAIILPLRLISKKWFSMTGLVIGSMLPDFEYFLRMKIKSIYSHTTAGIFWFDLLLGIIFAFVFHNIVRNSLFDNLPKFLRSRFLTYTQFNWNIYFKKNWLIVILSIIIGTCSHILWDSFTHDDGHFVKTIPLLSQSVHIANIELPVLKLLQHSSTLIGGLVVVFAIVSLPKNSVTNKINPKYWVNFSVIFLLILALRFLTEPVSYNQFGNIIVSGIAAMSISLILTSLIFNK